MLFGREFESCLFSPPLPHWVTYTGLHRQNSLSLPPLPTSIHSRPPAIILSLISPPSIFQLSNFSSNMPAAPKSPKRAGAPKGKGAVRAKSGCYTCRYVPPSLSLSFTNTPILESVVKNATKNQMRTTIAKPVFVCVSSASVLAPSVLNGSGWVPPMLVLVLPWLTSVYAGQPQCPRRTRQN
jgi:hypothetical protein